MHMHGVSALACVHISPQREREGLGAVCQSIEGERERVRERERERESPAGARTDRGHTIVAPSAWLLGRLSWGLKKRRTLRQAVPPRHRWAGRSLAVPLHAVGCTAQRGRPVVLRRKQRLPAIARGA